MSMWPSHAQRTAAANDPTMAHTMARPAGGGGERRTSMAAGRNSSSRCRRPVCTRITPRPIDWRAILKPIEARIVAPVLEQIVVCALLHYFALLDHDDPIGAAQRAQTMGN